MLDDITSNDYSNGIAIKSYEHNVEFYIKIKKWSLYLEVLELGDITANHESDRRLYNLQSKCLSILYYVIDINSRYHLLL